MCNVPPPTTTRLINKHENLSIRSAYVCVFINVPVDDSFIGGRIIKAHAFADDPNAVGPVRGTLDAFQFGSAAAAFFAALALAYWIIARLMEFEEIAKCSAEPLYFFGSAYAEARGRRDGRYCGTEKVMNSRTERVDCQIEQQNSEIRAFFGDDIPWTALNKCGERDGEEENEIGLPTLELTYIILFGYRSQAAQRIIHTQHTRPHFQMNFSSRAPTLVRSASHACYLLFCVRCFFVLFLHFSILILRCWLLFLLISFRFVWEHFYHNETTRNVCLDFFHAARHTTIC